MTVPTHPFALRARPTPCGDHPVDHQPVDHQPVDHHPVDHHPVDQQPVDDHPIASMIMQGVPGSCQHVPWMSTSALTQAGLIEAGPATSERRSAGRGKR
jgi:hypothetical protein